MADTPNFNDVINQSYWDKLRDMNYDPTAIADFNKSMQAEVDIPTELAKWKAQDPTINWNAAQQFKNYDKYFTSEGAFRPGTDVSVDDLQKIIAQYDRQQAEDAAVPGWEKNLDKAAKLAAAGVAAYIGGNMLTGLTGLGGAAETAAPAVVEGTPAITPSMGGLGTLSANLQNPALLDLAPVTSISPEVLTSLSSVPEIAGAVAAGAATPSAVSRAVDAATNYLSKYADPSFLATEAGKVALSNAVSQLITTGSIDLGKVFNPESFAKGMLTSAAVGAGTAAGSSGLQSIGMAKNVANPLATAGVRAIMGKDPTSSLVGAGLGYLDTPASIAKYANPALTGLIQGNTAGLKNAVLSGALDQVQMPDLGWTNKSSPLSWVSPAIKSGAIRGVSGLLNKKG